MARLLDGTRIYGNATIDSNLVISGNYAATSTTTGSLQLTGGAGITGNLYVGGNLSIAGNTTFINTTTITTTDTIAAPTINAGTIGNSGATFSGASGTLTGLFTASNLNLSLTTASTVTAVLTRGSDPNFQLTSQNGSSSNATGAETARFGVNYSGTGWDSFIQFIRGSGAQSGSLALYAANTAVANVSSTSIYPVSNNNITLGGASSQYFSAIYANNHYVSGSILPGANIQANIGGVGSNYFNYIYGVNFVGTSTTAKYADLAEMYHSDSYYSPGTVMILGGDYDVTVSTHTHDTAVAGVVSTNPAYLMNDNFEHDNWLPIALTGRVPCLVRGPVNKGTLLVSSSERGVACALDKSLYQPGCIIGKSMDIILDDSIVKIEIAVGRF